MAGHTGNSRRKWCAFEQMARKPAGGFCFINSMTILRAWAAYDSKIIRLLDLRVWLGCFELVARRCGLQEGCPARYRIEELHSLVGGRGGRHLRQSLHRLESAGILRWSESGIDFGGRVAADSLDTPVAGVPNRPVPVPRRVIRRIAAGTSRAMLATTLGHMLRCLHYRNGQCVSGGYCKASWVAETFGVHERNVKAARRRLVLEGWIIISPVSQMVLNRGGAAVIWNLEATESMLESPPLLAKTETQTPLPMKNIQLSSRLKKQELAGARGVLRQVAPRSAATVPANASLRNISLADLADPQRLDSLHAQAAAAGWVSLAECDRLNVLAAAEHARRSGRDNPPGLFVWLVQHRRWEYITQADEDAARRCLRFEISTSMPAGEQKGPLQTEVRDLVEQVLRSLGRPGTPGNAR